MHGERTGVTVPRPQNPRLALLRHRLIECDENGNWTRRGGMPSVPRGMPESLQSSRKPLPTPYDWRPIMRGLRLLCASVLLLIFAACATDTRPSVLPASPSRLPVPPPLSAELSKPMPACFHSAMQSYLQSSDAQQIERCLSEIGVRSSTPE